MHEEHRASPESTRRRKQRKNTIENQTEKLQKRKGAKKRRKRITRCESPSPRPIKKGSTKLLRKKSFVHRFPKN